MNSFDNATLNDLSDKLLVATNDMKKHVEVINNFHDGLKVEPTDLHAALTAARNAGLLKNATKDIRVTVPMEFITKIQHRFSELMSPSEFKAFENFTADVLAQDMTGVQALANAVGDHFKTVGK